MSIVSLFSGSWCHGDEVARTVAERLDYRLIDSELVDKAAEISGASRESLRRAMQEPPSLFNNITHERERCVAALKLAMARLLQSGDCVYHGFGAHLVARRISHILHVCLIANRDYRINLAMKEQGASNAKAAKMLQQEDEERFRWVHYLTRKKAWAPELYDLVVPMHDRSVEEASDLICENAGNKLLKPTESSKRAMADFLISAEVNRDLVEKGYRYDVSCVDGEVIVRMDKSAFLQSRLESKIQELARGVSGVREVTIRVDKASLLETPFGRLEAEPPMKILLVDDEREFVETLSERLRARELPAAVAYDGEGALAAVQEEEPEVMVLDLKMPGIDGLEVLKRIKKEKPSVEVIILTGHGSMEDEQLARELGAFAYLEKPADINQLTKVMKEAYKKARRSVGPGDSEG